jgi:hypothetical protein
MWTLGSMSRNNFVHLSVSSLERLEHQEAS